MKSKICILISLIILTTFAFAVDNSGANAPEVYQGLYPIKYNQSGDVIFTSTSDSDWYNYSEGRWANAVTLDKQGQMNPSAATVDNITGYYVWIPRYAYLIRTGYNSSNTGRIDIRFLNGTTNTDINGNTYYTINDLDNESNKWEQVNAVTYMGDRQMEYLVHPAFYFEGELAGIWVGKYEAGFSEEADVNRDGRITDEDVNIIKQFVMHNVTLNPIYNYDVDESGSAGANDVLFIQQRVMGIEGSVINKVLTNGETSKNLTISDAFNRIRDMVSKSENYDKYNLYGLAVEVNTHLIKATEYGAVVYLSGSIYEPQEDYKVHDINSGKEYIAGGLEGTTGITIDKYIDEYVKDEEGNIIDIKGSAYLETSDGTTAWNNETTAGNGLDNSAGTIVKEGAYGTIASNGQASDIGFRVALTKGSNTNKVKDVYLAGYEKSSSGSPIGNIPCCWLMDNGDVWVMGENGSGQLGLGDKSYRYLTEKLTLDAQGNKIPKIKQIASSSTNTFYLSEDGRVYACGQNNYGQLGLGIEDSKVYTITEVPIPVAEKVKEMQIVSNSVYYLTENGRVYACGQNNNGKLGIGSEEANVYTITEVTIPVGEKVKEIQIQCREVLAQVGIS